MQSEFLLIFMHYSEWLKSYAANNMHWNLIFKILGQANVFTDKILLCFKTATVMFSYLSKFYELTSPIAINIFCITNSDS